ncbi:MAG: hypothetical protein NVS9B14_02690 [Candidatus Acidiferrum sp.]
MGWQADYRGKLQSAEDALACVQSGMRVYIQPGCGEPEALVRALLKRRRLCGMWKWCIC